MLSLIFLLTIGLTQYQLITVIFQMDCWLKSEEKNPNNFLNSPTEVTPRVLEPPKLYIDQLYSPFSTLYFFCSLKTMFFAL